jgi:lipopolysaccharide transport protein LptA
MKQIKQSEIVLVRWPSVAILLLAGLLWCAVMPLTAQAETVTIKSDHLDIWEQKQEALFTGSVHLVRGDFELFCDSLRAFYLSGAEGGGIDRAHAVGHVRMIQGGKKGTSDSAIIDNKKQIVTLSGHAVMEQDGGRVEGETIVHNLAAKTTEVLQGGDGRVTLRIDDKKMDADGTQAGAGGSNAPDTGKEEQQP